MMVGDARKESGFTLLEALVVLVILALAAMIAWPRISTPSPSLTLQAAALQLAGELRSARASAMRSASTQTVTIDPSGKTYWGAGTKRRRLPAKARVLVVGRNVALDAAGRTQIQFGPDGRSNGGAIVMRLGGLRTTVAVDWMTGGTQIARGQWP